MKFVIITSCFNRQETIGDCINSIIKQDYDDIEHIVIDGDSTDSTLNIIKSYSNHISKIVSEPDHGMYDAINKGIKLATGDIIGLVHSDDMLYSSETISHIAKCFEATGADLVYGNGLFVDYNDTTKVVRNWISGKYSKTKMKFGWLPLHPTVYIKRKCIEQLGLYDENYKIAADSDFLIRYLYENNLKVHYLNEYIIKMRMGGLSTDRKKMKQKWNEDLRLYRNHGFLPHFTLACKIVSKVPQFISAKFIK
jgi:glycosyltransferase involved in cell wall biosynthesis